MARQRPGRIGTTLALLIALGGAVFVGGVLAITRPFTSEVARTAPTASRPSARLAITAAAPPAPTATTLGSPSAAQATISGIPTATPTVPSNAATSATAPPPAPTPALAVWTVVGRWQADHLIITEPFTTPGPWRLCWAQPDARGTFQVMVGNPEQTAWNLLSAPIGVTSGAFDLPQGGSYRLMFHGETPYTALAVVTASGTPSADRSPPPCG
ncbi:MAG TPA: hypothetical protein VIL85_26855 [Thermomicrobiales bacterium]